MTERDLAHLPLFTHLPWDEVAHLTASLPMVEMSAGALLFREDEAGEVCYIILEGAVAIVKARGTPDERLISLRGAGALIGEMSLLAEGGRRSASAVVETAGRALLLGRDEFDALLHRHPSMAYGLVRMMSDRLHDAQDAAIRDLRERNQRLAAAYAELKAAQAQIIEKERLEHELRLAREIQISILPRALPEVPGYSLGARMQPARMVGGDFFDALRLPDGSLGIAIGDVTDKGVPAAIFMAQTRALLRAEIRRAWSPHAALAGVNRLLLQMNDAGLFVTVLYGVLDPATGVLRYVRAGHELPLVAHADGRVAAAPLGRGMALGLIEDPPLDEQELTIPPGGALLLYSDGATDARSPGGAEFGLARLREALTGLGSAPGDALCAGVLRALADFQGSGPQHDDITLVAVRRAPAGA